MNPGGSFYTPVKYLEEKTDFFIDTGITKPIIRKHRVFFCIETAVGVVFYIALLCKC